MTTIQHCVLSCCFGLRIHSGPSRMAGAIPGSPLLVASHSPDAHTAQVCFALGSFRQRCPELRGNHLKYQMIVSHLQYTSIRRAAPCLSALISLRQAIKAVGHYA